MTIEPIDLKTTGKSEEEFEKSFMDWNYWIQASMYSCILQTIMQESDEYKNYTLLPFKFLKKKKNNLSPLVWMVSFEYLRNDIIQIFGLTWVDLLEDAYWHLQNGKFDYSRKSYENNGCNPIILKL